NGAECIKLLAKLKPDILLLDLRMPDKDGLAVLEEVNFDTLPTRVVVLTAAEDDRDVVRAMRLGARGVVLKQSATDLLVKSIHRVHAGEIWLDNRMTAEVMKAFSKSSEAGPRREKPLLSDREKEIVQLVAQGFFFAVTEQRFLAARPGFGGFRERLHNFRGHAIVEPDFAGVHTMNALHQQIRRGLLQHDAASAEAHRADHIAIVLGCGEHHDARRQGVEIEIGRAHV